MFSQRRLCDSWNDDEAPSASGVREVRWVDLALVHAVPELVEAREHSHQVVAVEARSQADVRLRQVRRERVHRVVEPPRLVVHPPAGEHLERERALPIDREVAADGRVVDRLPETRDERHEDLLQPREDRRHVGSRHARLVVVEQDVVGVLERCETVGVPLCELEPALEVRAEELEVRRGARLEPVDVPLRAGSRELGAQLARDTSLLLVVAPGNPDHARLDRLTGRRLPRAPAARRGASRARERWRARVRSGRASWPARPAREHRVAASSSPVPAEQEAGALDVRDLDRTPQELVEAGTEVSHDRGAYPPTRARMTAHDRLLTPKTPDRHEISCSQDTSVSDT